MTEEPEGMGSDGEPSSSVSRTEGGRPGQESSLLVRENQGCAISSYRYLRLAIVTVILTLAVSLVSERVHANCWNASISSYYYTPVHSIFVAALGVIGFALIAIRGGTLVEEILLNMAGFLAPVVAFVPTGWSSADCPSNLTSASKMTVAHLLSENRLVATFSTNNLVAFIVGIVIGTVLATLLTLISAKRARRSSRDSNRVILPRELAVPVLGSGLVVIAGFIWHTVWPATFNAHAHSYAAILMFILVALVMLSTAERDRSTSYRQLYFACPTVMATGGIVVVLVGRIVTWRHEVLVLESIEVTVFVVFWFFQTIELWDGGLSEPEEPEGDGPLRRLSRRVVRRLRPARAA